MPSELEFDASPRLKSESIVPILFGAFARRVWWSTPVVVFLGIRLFDSKESRSFFFDFSGDGLVVGQFGRAWILGIGRGLKPDRIYRWFELGTDLELPMRGRGFEQIAARHWFRRRVGEAGSSPERSL